MWLPQGYINNPQISILQVSDLLGEVNTRLSSQRNFKLLLVGKKKKKAVENPYHIVSHNLIMLQTQNVCADINVEYFQLVFL